MKNFKPLHISHQLRRIHDFYEVHADNPYVENDRIKYAAYCNTLEKTIKILHEFHHIFGDK